MRIAVDAMGGDRAPVVELEGAVDAVRDVTGIKGKLVIEV